MSEDEMTKPCFACGKEVPMSNPYSICDECNVKEMSEVMEIRRKRLEK